jgi:putative ABC transport system permease protein
MRQLSWFEDREAILDNLREEYRDRVQIQGKFFARWWYRLHVLRSVVPLVGFNLRWRIDMLNNYLKIALRNIKRYKGYSLINILGLATGMACCLLIVLYIQDELSYDAFHVNADRIFRVVTSTSGDGTPTNATGTFGTGPAMREDFPEVVDFVRIRNMGQGTRIYIGHEDRKFYEERFFFADPSIFKVFTFPLLRGDTEKVLSEPNSIVITESMAEKYFGHEDPMGQTLETDPYNSGEMMVFRVTGIAEDVPGNSHFHFDFLASYVNQQEDLNSFSGLRPHYTYVLLQDASQAAGLESRLPDFVRRHFGEDPWYTNHLQPIRKIRLHSLLRSEIESTGNMAYVTIFSLVAVFVLIIACINTINLSTARSLKRAREVGLRKVVGARRKQLMGQFLGESLLISLLGGLLALVLAALFLPLFNTIAEKEVTLHFLTGVIPLASLMGIVAVVGIVSGGYVAFVLSGLMPLQVLKGDLTSDSRKRKLREGMVIFQFILATIMIIGALTAHKQMRFIQTHNTGYHRDEILVIPLNREARAGYIALRNELLMCPAIRNTATSSYVPTRGSMHESVSFEDLDQNLTPVLYFIDKEFVNTYGIQILYGTDFTHEIPQPSNAEFLVSTQTLAEAGYPSPEEALGKRVEWMEYSGSITGVINDMNLYSFHRAAYPMILLVTCIEQHDYLSVRLDANRYGEALTAIQSVWRRLIPSFPLDYFFLDESFEALHRADRRLGYIFQFFSAIAVFIACMGLFGLALFTAEQKTKEIGIRKVFGASVYGIVLLLTREFSKCVLIANVIAWPIAYYIMSQWLQNFAYRTTVGMWTFIVTTVLSLSVAILTVGTRAVRAAMANPVDSLRYE